LGCGGDALIPKHKVELLLRAVLPGFQHKRSVEMSFSVKREITPVLAFLVPVVVLVSIIALAATWGSALFWLFLPQTLFIYYIILGTPLIMAYYVDSDAIYIRGPFGRIILPKDQIRQVEIGEFKVKYRTLGIGTVGAVYGQFDTTPWGMVRLYGGIESGKGVVVSIRDQARVILTPTETTGFINHLRKLGFPVVE
jgi:hypothetical protein